MPVNLAPYASAPVSFTAPNGAQSQLVCSGCRSLLLYPHGATSVCCAVCNAFNAVPTPGTEMAQLVCRGCRTTLMYIKGATYVRCTCCLTLNHAFEANQIAHVNCGNCKMLLMYQCGVQSVKCAVCSFVTSIAAFSSAEVR
ncbi:protein LSD1-like [Nymphaea colorata]|nr:protein LSD1-like [Nymphaea colorata]XP_049933501.1 protein LSD1-like [Nymphaea colorata]XP_049933502.1 protein LSD1-like [Nymphaea colorata]XP_049933503.1 protein LSD1-like [Nymphaea colorata]XP_049933504.1 protein LSD1-like [Nymphaea colorata]